MSIRPLGLAAALCLALTACSDRAPGADAQEEDGSVNVVAASKGRKWEKWAKAIELESDVGDVVGDAPTSLVDAVDVASAACRGTVVAAELEGSVEEGLRSIYYAVRVVADRDVFDVKVDTGTGAVVSVHAQVDATRAAETRVLAASIPAGAKELVDLVVRAEARTNGAHAYKAAFEVGHGKSNCKVFLLRGRVLFEVDVDPSHPEAEGPAPKVSQVEGSDADDGDDEDDEDDEMDALLK